MKRRVTEFRLKIVAFALLILCLDTGEHRAQSTEVRAPVLMWKDGGCLAGPKCQTGWYSSPAVVDLDRDGQADVVWGAYDVVAVNGANGNLKWRAASANRVWPGVAIADLTGDGTPEVIVGRSSDQLTVYDRLGNAFWTRSPFGSGEIRTLAVTDLEDDGQIEIIAGHAGGGSFQINVLTPGGATRAGWPARHAGEPGFGTGLFNQNVAVADMNGDGVKELFAPTSAHYITALDRSGNQLGVNGIYEPRRFWSEVGVHVDHAVDLRGYALCGVEHRPNFQDSAPVVADVNADGVPEVVVVGNVQNCLTNASLYHMPFIFKLDRTRWSGSGFDWTTVPAPGPGSAPRSSDYNVIETAVPNPVVVDLDGDGLKEVLFPSYDGKVHAYWLDKTEHGNWPYTVPAAGGSADDFRFAGEPIVADLNGDGRPEVIFTSWPKKASGRAGQLHILSAQGVELHRIDLPAPSIGATWNGGLGAPTIANIDSDADLELVVGTVASGVVAYKLPNTSNAQILWGTGRGNYGRTGVAVTAAAAPPPPLPDTTPPAVTMTAPVSGSTLSGTITVNASASDNTGVAGVQFQLDGANLSAEDTAAPYAISWDTTRASNGSHTLTAVARDAAGNRATSSAVTVTVSNAPPPDTTPPTVTMTAPGSGSTLSGTITVSASASDNAGIAGVQFQLDGANLSAEDTAAPYAISWDTTRASNGSHTLTAAARDAAGNRASSNPITVMVSNVSRTAARFEETELSIAYTAGWYHGNAQRAWTFGSAAVSNTVDAQATFNFTGTSVKWVGFRGPQAGIARVVLDGVVAGDVDAFSSAEEIQAVVFSAADLRAGSHVLRIEVSGRKNPASTDAFIVVDAFDVMPSSPPPAAGTRFEETGASVAYAAGWTAGDTTRPWSGGTAARSAVAGSRTTFSFTGNTVGWVGLAGPENGIARVLLDGGFVAEIDTFSPTELQAVLFRTTRLSPTRHTLTIEVSGRKNPASTGSEVVVDAFDVRTRFEETDPSSTYTAGWFPGNVARGWSGGTATRATKAGERLTFSFTGTSVSCIGFRGPQTGIAYVFLDDAFAGEVDTFSTAEQVQAVLFTATDLAAGSHTLTIEVTGRKNPASTFIQIIVDAFDITP